MANRDDQIFGGIKLTGLQLRTVREALQARILRLEVLVRAPDADVAMQRHANTEIALTKDILAIPLPDPES